LQFYQKTKPFIKQIQTHTYTFTIFFPFFFLFFSYTLQIIQIQKLNKNYIKHFKNYKTAPKTPGIAGKTFCTTGTVSGILLEPQDSGGVFVPRAAAADEANKTSGLGTSSSSLSSYADGKGHRHLQQNKKCTNSGRF